MSEQQNGTLLSEADIQLFQQNGYLISRGLFRDEEVEFLLENFMEMNANDEGVIPMDEAKRRGDVLQAYPRLMHPHRTNEVALRYLLDSRVATILNGLLGEDALAIQSMVYFKPPGAKGQALHQDNFYLKVEPGTCIAAWTALDAATEENGGLMIVPNTQLEEIQCPHLANPEESFTTEEVDVPEGLTPVMANLAAGDVLFFNGNVIHGSYPNRTENRFRRAFICHYAGVSAEKITDYCFPVYAMDGSNPEREVNTDGGPCGTEYEVSEAP